MNVQGFPNAPCECGIIYFIGRRCRRQEYPGAARVEIIRGEYHEREHA